MESITIKVSGNNSGAINSIRTLFEAHKIEVLHTPLIYGGNVLSFTDGMYDTQANLLYIQLQKIEKAVLDKLSTIENVFVS